MATLAHNALDSQPSKATIPAQPAGACPPHGLDPPAEAGDESGLARARRAARLGVVTNTLRRSPHAHEGASGNTAVASISTFASASMSEDTSTTDIAG